MILVIGFGNDLRQDDGAGLHLAKVVEQVCCEQHIPVKRINVQQLLPELALEIAADDIDAVIFTDTEAMDERPPEPHIQISPIVIDTNPARIGHYLLPATLLVYANLLYRKQPEAWLLTVPGVAFDHGQSFSHVAEAALTSAKTEILGLLTGQLRPLLRPSSQPES